MIESNQNSLSKTPKISLLVPMYNEANNIRRFYKEAEQTLNSLGLPWEIVCINDGSNDDTLSCLLSLYQKGAKVKIIDFSRNFGKEVALSAGLDYISGDIVIPIDADMQHPPGVITELVEKWREGFDIVFAVRRTRETESWGKRVASKWFYNVLGRITDVPNHNKIGDFCLLDRRIVNILKEMPEHNRFMKGLFSWVGFKQGFVSFDPQIRSAGETKWNYWRLWNFAIQGITSFSDMPLRVWTYIGFGISFIGLIYALFFVIKTIVLGIDVPGYPSLIVSILFMGGVQLISLGVLGEYIGRIHKEVKNRPLYLVRKLYGFNNSETKGSGNSDTIRSDNV